MGGQLLHNPRWVDAAGTETPEFSKDNGADEGARTLDLRFTKPLLYQLSYVG